MEDSKNQVNKAKNTPPYLPVGKIEQIMTLVETRTLNEVDTKYFRAYGFGETDAILAVNALKFLGVVDANSRATDLMRKMQMRGDAGTASKREVVKAAYRDLFSRVSNANELTRDELINEIMHVYAVSPRIAATAAPAFLKFCEYAGLREPSTTQQKKQTTSKKKVVGQKPPKKTAVPSEEKDQVRHAAVDREGYEIEVIPGKFVLFVPTEIHKKSWVDDDVNHDLRALVKSIKMFAEKHLPERGGQ